MHYFVMMKRNENPMKTTKSWTNENNEKVDKKRILNGERKTWERQKYPNRAKIPETKFPIKMNSNPEKVQILEKKPKMYQKKTCTQVN